MSLELGWRHVVERLVDPAFVEPVDVGERRPLDVLDVAPGSLAVNQLGLVEAVEALGERVVVGVSLGPHRRDDGCLVKSLGVANPEILDAPVGMMDQAREVERVARVDRHLERVDGEVAAQRRRDLPADDGPAEHVGDERDVDPARVGLDVGEVRDPEAVGSAGRELAFDQVARAVLAVVGPRRHLEVPTPTDP